MADVDDTTRTVGGAPAPADYDIDIDFAAWLGVAESEPESDDRSDSERENEPEPEHPTWAALRAACPLLGASYGALGTVPQDVVHAMGLRRRSRGDDLVVDLLAWAPIYRNEAEQRRGKLVVEASGYGRTRLCLAVRMHREVEDNDGIIPAAWLGLGPDGVEELLRTSGESDASPDEEPTKTPKTPNEEDQAPEPLLDPKAEVKALKSLFERAAAPEGRRALHADPRSAKRVIGQAMDLIHVALQTLPEEDRGTTLGHLSGGVARLRLPAHPAGLSEDRLQRGVDGTGLVTDVGERDPVEPQHLALHREEPGGGAVLSGVSRLLPDAAEVQEERRSSLWESLGLLLGELLQDHLTVAVDGGAVLPRLLAEVRDHGLRPRLRPDGLLYEVEAGLGSQWFAESSTSLVFLAGSRAKFDVGERGRLSDDLTLDLGRRLHDPDGPRQRGEELALELRG